MKQLSIAKNTMYNTLGSGFYLVCNWLITVLVIRFGSVEKGGILALVMSVTNIFFSLSTFGIRNYQISDYAKKYSSGMYVATRLITCCCALVLCVLYSILAPGNTQYETLCIAVYMLFRIGEALSDENQVLQLTAGRMDYACASFVLRGILLIGSFTGALVLSHDLLTAIAAMAVSTGLVVALFEFPVSRKIHPFRLEFEWKTSLQLLRDNLPLLAHSLFMVLLVSIPRTRLNAIWGNYWMGIYGSVAAPAAVMQSAALWIFTPSLPKFSSCWGEKDRAGFYRLHRRISILLAAVGAVLLAGAAVLGKWGLNLVFGPDIAEHDRLLLSTMVITMLIALEYYLASLLTVARKMKVIFMANLTALAVTLAFSSMLIEKHGAEGVNWMIGISMMINCVVLYIGFRAAGSRHFG